MAIVKAAFKLPTLAFPVPARSNAVPWSTEVRINGKPKVIFTAYQNLRALRQVIPGHDTSQVLHLHL